MWRAIDTPFGRALDADDYDSMIQDNFIVCIGLPHVNWTIFMQYIFVHLHIFLTASKSQCQQRLGYAQQNNQKQCSPNVCSQC